MHVLNLRLSSSSSVTKVGNESRNESRVGFFCWDLNFEDSSFRIKPTRLGVSFPAILYPETGNESGVFFNELRISSATKVGNLLRNSHPEAIKSSASAETTKVETKAKVGYESQTNNLKRRAAARGGTTSSQSKFFWFWRFVTQASTYTGKPPTSDELPSSHQSHQAIQLCSQVMSTIGSDPRNSWRPHQDDPIVLAGDEHDWIRPAQLLAPAEGRAERSCH